MPEDKIARICWNTKNWIEPSGKVGKSKNKAAYESDTGYGHEEWLLDISKLVDGYHYAYLQAISQHRQKYLGEVFNISIYTINSDTKQRWWVGTINNVEVIDEAESKRVYKVYEKNGWHDEMVSQLRAVEADYKDFKNNINPKWFAVIKFKPSDLDLLDTPQEFHHSDPAVTSDYYNLKNKENVPIFISTPAFVFEAGHKEGKFVKETVYGGGKDVTKQTDLLHNQMQTVLYNSLVEVYGKDNVGTEQTVASGRVDIVVKHESSYTFYELKTNNTALGCVREAMGQLLEYAHYKENIKIERLVIVSQHQATPDVVAYLDKLRVAYQLPIFYECVGC